MSSTHKSFDNDAIELYPPNIYIRGPTAVDECPATGVKPKILPSYEECFKLDDEEEEEEEEDEEEDEEEL